LGKDLLSTVFDESGIEVAGNSDRADDGIGGEAFATQPGGDKSSRVVEAGEVLVHIEEEGASSLSVQLDSLSPETGLVGSRVVELGSEVLACAVLPEVGVFGRVIRMLGIG
jgi:hypothetical protein